MGGVGAIAVSDEARMADDGCTNEPDIPDGAYLADADARRLPTRAGTLSTGGIVMEMPWRWRWTYRVQQNGRANVYDVIEQCHGPWSWPAGEEIVLSSFATRQEAERYCLWQRGWSLEEIDAGDVVYVHEGCVR